MTPVDERLVEMTWKEVASFSPARARQEMLRLGKKQPNLLAFVTTSYGTLQFFRLFRKKKVKSALGSLGVDVQSHVHSG